MIVFQSPPCVVVGGISYFVHPEIIGRVISVPPGTELNFKPVVVLPALDESQTIENVLDLIAHFSVVDDVYSDHFKHTLVLQMIPSHNNSALLDSFNRSEHFSCVHVAFSKSTDSILPAGPYFLQGRHVHQAWRLYPDELDAFMITVYPPKVSVSTEFAVLNYVSAGGVWRNVAVPSRLYHQPSKSKPLNGLRISIKDTFHLAGVQTTMASRAYMELYGADSESANYVNLLVELGAIIVGKSKISPFASFDSPTDQWVDFISPTNPRGDRYQSPAISSSGAAASLAGYLWLDFAMGTDTIGSVRAPAAANGLFCLRPSHNTTSMSGIQPGCSPFDVVGPLSRSIQLLKQVTASTLQLQDSTKFPPKIIMPVDFFPCENKQHQAMIESFVSILENFLQVKRTELSLIELWNEQTPAAANGMPLKEYLANSAFRPMCYDFFHAFKGFRRKYKAKFNKLPYVTPVVKYRWNVGESMSTEEYEQGWAEQQVFREWFNENVMSSNPESQSTAIMVMPFGSADPDYRDVPHLPPFSPKTFDYIEGFLSPILQIPQLVIPIGQIPYQSRISGDLEYKPIVVTILGAKGSDLMLINLAKAALESGGWPTEVQTGRFMFKPA